MPQLQRMSVGSRDFSEERGRRSVGAEYACWRTEELGATDVSEAKPLGAMTEAET